MSDPARPPSVAVVVPCYRTRARILDVLARIGGEVSRIYVVDDCCPERTGEWVEEQCRDGRVRVLRHERRRGVGGATITGYRQALADGAAVLVKLDGDGQMDPALIRRIVAPILAGEADYTKGNRFFRLDDLREMPAVRLFGNSVLSFLTKLSTGYWGIFDPTNGYTAIHHLVLRELPLDKISQGYFFESDLLFRLGTIRAAVAEVPMAAHYGGEPSSLDVTRAAGEFLGQHLVNLGKRVFYTYYLRGFNIASIELVLGLAATIFGSSIGAYHWLRSSRLALEASSGTVMLAALPVIVGVQLLLAFLSYDMQNVPRVALHRRLLDDPLPRPPA